MKTLVVVLLFFFSFTLKAQIITTILGSTSGIIYDPGQLAFDKNGNLYIGEALGYRVIKMDTGNIFSIFAGTGSIGYNGDNGLANIAEFDQPYNLAISKFENVYIGDAGNRRIRKVDINTGIVTTIAGTGNVVYSGDGVPATMATVAPSGLYFDKYSNLYLASLSQKRIRKIDTNGIITTIAGNGIYGSTGDGGPAIAANCAPDYNMCMDATGNLFFIEFSNNTIRKISSSGIISTIAGDTSGAYSYTGDGVPALGAPMGPGAIVFDKNGLLVICDYQNNRIRRIDALGIIHTIVGNGFMGNSGDNGLADSAELNRPGGIAFDHCGNLYIAQVNDGHIRKVSFNPTCNLSVPEVKTENEVSIYPNPTHEEITITGVKTDVKWCLFSIKSIIEQQGVLKAGSNTLSIEALSPGLYILELTMDDGTRIMKKIIKM